MKNIKIRTDRKSKAVERTNGSGLEEKSVKIGMKDGPIDFIRVEKTIERETIERCFRFFFLFSNI